MKPRQPIHTDTVPIPAELIPKDKRGYKRLVFVLHDNLFSREEVFLMGERTSFSVLNFLNI